VSDRRGFALLAALWLLVAFSIAGLALSASGRARRLAAANLSEATTAQAAAAGGLDQLRQRLALRLDMAAGSTLDPWHGVDSVMPDTLALGVERVLVRAHDTGVALNLNRADDEELRRLFIALRVDAGEADRLAQAIADWRDPMISTGRAVLSATHTSPPARGRCLGTGRFSRWRSCWACGG